MPPEEKVTAVAEKPSSFKDHYEAAKSAQSSTEDQGEPPVKVDDTPPETPPAQEPEKPADEPTETGEPPDTLLSEEEVRQLSAKDRKLYEKAQKNYTQKTQKLAADRKAMEEWTPLIDGLKADPDATLEKLAKERGFVLQKPETKQESTSADDLPEELKFLEPIFSAREKALEAKIRAEMAPVKDGLDRMTSEAIAAETQSTIAQFSADPRYSNWKQHEARMLEIGAEFIPAKPMSDFKYMQHLYTLATAELNEAEQTKKLVTKINKSAANVDPAAPTVQDSRVEHALPPPGSRSMRDAWDAAKRGESWVAPK